MHSNNALSLFLSNGRDLRLPSSFFFLHFRKVCWTIPASEARAFRTIIWKGVRTGVLAQLGRFAGVAISVHIVSMANGTTVGIVSGPELIKYLWDNCAVITTNTAFISEIDLIGAHIGTKRSPMVAVMLDKSSPAIELHSAGEKSRCETPRAPLLVDVLLAAVCALLPKIDALALTSSPEWEVQLRCSRLNLSIRLARPGMLSIEAIEAKN